MKQSLDQAFCEYMVNQKIISKQNIHDINNQYPDICIREALLLENKINLEYYIATLSTLKQRQLNKCTTSEIWDTNFFKHLRDKEILNKKELEIFQNKLNVDCMSAREHLLIMGIINFESYKKIFNELLQEPDSNNKDFDTSTIAFIEKKLDSMETSLKTSASNSSKKVEENNSFVEDASAATLDTNDIYNEDASAKTLDTPISSDFKNVMNNKNNAFSLEEASAVTLENKVSPIPQNTMPNQTTMELNPITIHPDEENNNYWEDASAATLNSVESPISENPKNNSPASYWEDVSAATLNNVESPISENPKNNSPASYWEDISAATLNNVESPISEDPKNNSNHLNNPKDELTLDTAKTITSDITFAEYLGNINTEETSNIVNAPVQDDYSNQKTVHQNILNEIPQVYDASSETLLEEDGSIHGDFVDTLIDKQIVAEEERAITVQENLNRNADATLDINEQDLILSQSDDYQEKHAPSEQNGEHNERAMYEAFPSSIVDRIGGLDEKTTHLTNLVREMRESQALQLPANFHKSRNYLLYSLITTFIITCTATMAFVWKNSQTNIKKDISIQNLSNPGILYYRNGNYQQAIKLLRDSKNISDQYFLALSYFKLGEYQEALNTTKKIIILEKDDPKYLFLLAQIYHIQKEFGEALKIYQQCLELGHPKTLVQLEQARIYMELEVIEEAQKLFVDIEKEMPNSPLLLEMQGDIFLSNYNLKMAIEKYSQAIEKNNSVINAAYLFFKRAKTYYEMDLSAKAIEDLQKTVLLNQNLTDAHYYMGLAYVKEKNARYASESFDKALAMAPNAVLYLQKRSELFYFTNKLELAFKDIEAAIKIFPRDGLSFAYRALLYLKQKKIDLAEKDMETALKFSKENAQVQLINARFLYYRNKLDSSIKAAQKSILLEKKNNWQAYEMLGDIYQKQGNSNLSKENWQLALDINPYVKSINKKLGKKK